MTSPSRVVNVDRFMDPLHCRKANKRGQYGRPALSSSTGELLLEAESDLRRDGPGRHVVSSAKGGQEVVQSDPVR